MSIWLKLNYHIIVMQQYLNINHNVVSYFTFLNRNILTVLLSFILILIMWTFENDEWCAIISIQKEVPLSSIE